ncbi:MAG: H-NS histone family protein [Xanthomonadaceae bacterium]|nr:H-NS histone family protein [Xanthomonadaceae bacterium]
MSMNIDNLSSQELAALISRANKRKKVLAKRKPAAAAKAAVAKALKLTGWTFEELFGKQAAAAPAAKPRKNKAKAGTRGGKVAPKYRNPANEKETWTGRGRSPLWLSALLATGRKQEEFLIQK